MACPKFCTCEGRTCPTCLLHRLAIHSVYEGTGFKRRYGSPAQKFQPTDRCRDRHDLPAVAALLFDSPSTLFVAKSPDGWRGYWGKADVSTHFGELYKFAFPYRSGICHRGDRVSDGRCC